MFVAPKHNAQVFFVVFVVVDVVVVVETLFLRHKLNKMRTQSEDCHSFTLGRRGPLHTTYMLSAGHDFNNSLRHRRTGLFHTQTSCHCPFVRGVFSVLRGDGRHNFSICFFVGKQIQRAKKSFMLHAQGRRVYPEPRWSACTTEYTSIVVYAQALRDRNKCRVACVCTVCSKMTFIFCMAEANLHVNVAPESVPTRPVKVVSVLSCNLCYFPPSQCDGDRERERERDPLKNHKATCVHW